MQFKPVKQYRISSAVATQLKESIVLGNFMPGQKLPPERDLADQFQVSRVTIREALLKLEHTGFVVTRQGATGGTYVTELTFDNLVDAFVDLFLMGRISVPELLKVRLLVEPEIARLAALNFMPASAQRLKDAIQAEEITKTSLSKDALYSFRIFHYILAEMSGNRFLEALMRSLIGLTTKVVDVVSADPLSIHQVGMHHPILEAVLAGDGEAAAEAMKKHTIEFGENLIGAEESYRKKLSSGEKRTLFERNG